MAKSPSFFHNLAANAAARLDSKTAFGGEIRAERDEF